MREIKEKEIKEYLFDKYHSCLDTAMKYDLIIKQHYSRCGSCKHPRKHPTGCGRATKEQNLKTMLGEV